MIPFGRLGTTHLDVSRIAMGCNKLGSIRARQSERSAVRLVHAAIDAGIGLFDTADAYGSGTSEVILGAALRGNSTAVVATKIGYRFTERSRSAQFVHAALGSAQSAVSRRTVAPSAAYASQDFSEGYVRGAVHASLRRLRRQRIDLLQFHGPPNAASSDLPSVISDLIAEGAVRCFGVGCESLEVAESWAKVEGVSVLQVPFGVLDPQAASLIPSLHAAGIGVLVRGVLGGGVLARYLRGQAPGIDAERVRRIDRLQAFADVQGVGLAQLAFWYGRYGADADSIVLGISTEEQLSAAAEFAATARPDDTTIAALQAIVADRSA